MFESGLVGRMGGDEFAVLLYTPISREAIEASLQLFLEQIHKIELAHHRLSCSIGAVSITAAGTVEELYQGSDHLLYMAKQSGRDQYVIGSLEEALSSTKASL